MEKNVWHHMESFSAIVYRSMLLSSLNFKWLTGIKSKFDNCGFSYLFNNQFIVNVKNMSSIITQTLKDQNNQQWQESINISNTGKLYGELKQNLKLSPYFSKIPLQYALSIYKLKSCNLRFPIDVLAWQGIPYNQRKCDVRSTDIGDAYYNILVCNHSQHIRCELLPRYYIRHPSMVKYIELLNCNNKTLISSHT